MQYLRRLLILCRVIFARFDRLPEQVSPVEMTTHFIFARDNFNPSKKTVHAAAFMPPKDRRLSIYRTCRCSEGKIWWLGGQYVAKKRKKAVLARGDLLAVKFARVQLVISAGRADRSPHPRHANVIGWPDDKPVQKMKAVELANEATLVLKPEFPQ